MPESSTLPAAPSLLEIVAVAYDDPRAQRLRAQLDVDLDARYRGAEPEPPAVAAARADALRVHPDQLVATLLALRGGDALGHVVLRRLGEEWELKRLVVTPAARGGGIGRALVAEAIARASLGGAPRVILQTGAAQPESLALYGSFGFTPIPVYEPYVATMPNSLCFELPLRGR